MRVTPDLEAAEGQPSPASRSWLPATLAVIAGFFLLRLGLILSGFAPLAPDEAHYWEWSRRLAWGYYSKGPGVAAVIRAGTWLFGDTELGVRAGALFFGVATPLLVYFLGVRVLGSPRIGFLAGLILQFFPLSLAGGLLTTIDPPFVFCWGLFLLAAWEGSRPGRGRTWAAGWWILAGLALGAGTLTKYTMLFAVPSLLLFPLFSPEDRRQLRTPGPFLAFLACLVLLLPNVAWNAAHDWPSFKHVLTQGGMMAGEELGRSASFGLQPGSMLRFLGSQAAVTSPFVFPLLLWGFWRGARCGWGKGGVEPHCRAHRFLLAMSAPIFLTYLALSLFQSVAANWIAPFYLTATLAMVALVFPESRGRAEAAIALPGVGGSGATKSGRGSRDRGEPGGADAAPAAGGGIGAAGQQGTAGGRPRGRRSAAVAVAVSLFLTSLLVAGSLAFEDLRAIEGNPLRLSYRLDPLRRLRGWPELATAVEEFRQQATSAEEAAPFLFSSSYQIAGELAFYLPDHPTVYCINLGRRLNQYDLWPGPEGLEGQKAILVLADEILSPPRPVKRLFARLERPQVVHIRGAGGEVLGTFTLFYCRGFRGTNLWRAETMSY